MSLQSFFNSVHTLPECPLPKDSRLFDLAGTIQPMPAEWWSSFPREAKMLFGHHHGIYAFPTVELIAWLQSRIEGMKAIEIGAGSGGFCQALGITGTDNFQQVMPKYAELYRLTGQPAITYGQHIENLDAISAVRKHKPDAVLACWVTHKFDPRRDDLGGNEIGVDEAKLLQYVDNYFFVGNTKIHAAKPLLIDLQNGRITTHKIVEFVAGDPMLQSRSSGGVDFVVHIQRIK